MKKKYFIAAGLCIVFITTIYLYKTSIPQEIATPVNNEEEKSLEYFDSEQEIPANAVALSTNESTTGKVFAIQEQGNTIVYLAYVYPNVTPKPKLISYKKEDKNLVIKVKPAVIKEGSIGLTAMSYHYFKIEINQKVEKIILEEIK